MAAKKTIRTHARETTLRHLWLAGLGAVAIARREALNAANDAAARMESLKQQAGKRAGETQANLRESFASVFEQGGAQAERFSAEVEARLAPVLIKLGLRPQTRSKPTPRARKVSTKTAAPRTRTSARKVAAKPIAGKRAPGQRVSGKRASGKS